MEIDATDKELSPIEADVWRPKWFVILAHLYFWPKLIDYLVLCLALVLEDDYTTLLRVQINIPVYLAIGLYLFSGKLFSQWVWKLVFFVAFGDEILSAITDSVSIAEFFDIFPYYLLPLYFLCFWYAFCAKEIWREAHQNS
ncbi:hypothetical protein [Marinobacter salarius]|jgi:hypothetical protein|uniref:Transmembrane protein n=1 Tax=Marinobacter salarius TaxID=1420917 RepID=A0A1W6KB08_9GAMM|nr:hypothetical protein [Marinobacter salarius]ARM84614.1 hypothetical protein MARSALSMR5_02553 [Marinobacter salarius]